MQWSGRAATTKRCAVGCGDLLRSLKPRGTAGAPKACALLTCATHVKAPSAAAVRQGPKEARYPDESYDEEDEGQENSKEPKAPTVRNIQAGDRAEIAPQRRARALPLLVGMQRRNGEVGDQNESK